MAHEYHVRLNTLMPVDGPHQYSIVDWVWQKPSSTSTIVVLRHQGFHTNRNIIGLFYQHRTDQFFAVPSLCLSTLHACASTAEYRFRQHRRQWRFGQLLLSPSSSSTTSSRVVACYVGSDVATVPRTSCRSLLSPGPQWSIVVAHWTSAQTTHNQAHVCMSVIISS